MGSYDRVEACELVGTLFQSTLASSIPKENYSLYRDHDSILTRKQNGK